MRNPANAKKAEIWLTPRFLVDKVMPQLAPNHHLRAIVGNWDAAKAPIGILWTWGGWDEAWRCDYLTRGSMDEMAEDNFKKKYLGKKLEYVSSSDGFVTVYGCFEDLRTKESDKEMYDWCEHFTFRL